MLRFAGVTGAGVRFAGRPDASAMTVAAPRCADRANVRRPFVWLASYPKSGNTWTRLLLANFVADSEQAVHINHILKALPDFHPCDRGWFDRATGLPSSDCTDDEIEPLRPAALRAHAAEAGGGRRFCRVHEALRGRGRGLHPAAGAGSAARLHRARPALPALLPVGAVGRLAAASERGAGAAGHAPPRGGHADLRLRPAGGGMLTSAPPHAAAEGELFDKAAAALRRMLAAEPRNAAALARLGDLERRRGDFAAALTAYRRLLAVAPDDASAAPRRRRAGESVPRLLADRAALRQHRVLSQRLLARDHPRGVRRRVRRRALHGQRLGPRRSAAHMNPEPLSAGGAGRDAGSRPAALPLVTSAQDFGLPLDDLRDFMLRELPFRKPIRDSEAPGMTGWFDPLIGVVCGRRLAPRIGSLLSRPACRFSHAFTWRSGRGASHGAHLDRPEYDVTMSIPLVLDGVDRWPLWWEQPNGDRCDDWSGAPGTVLLMDGRWHRHGRDEFRGALSIVLLLSWKAPAVLWSGFLDEGARRGLAAAGPRLDPGSASGRELLDRCLALAQSSVPHGVEPEAAVCDPAQASAAVEASRGGGAAFVALLDGRAALTFGGADADADAVALQPGDGVAFPAATRCRLRWLKAGRGRALVGRARRATADA